MQERAPVVGNDSVDALALTENDITVHLGAIEVFLHDDVKADPAPGVALIVITALWQQFTISRAVSLREERVKAGLGKGLGWDMFRTMIAPATTLAPLSSFTTRA